MTESSIQSAFEGAEAYAPVETDYGEDRPDPISDPDLNSFERREAQRKVNMEIGEGSNTIPTATIHTLQDMLGQFVFIKDGSQVAPLARPQAVLSWNDFKNATAGSKHWAQRDQRMKQIPVALAWLEHPSRKEAETMTFRAGGKQITMAPDSGKVALNLWRPISRSTVPIDWEVCARPFVEHIEWLWRDDASAFLDWLAHIEQRPEVLPHYGWVHISREHGKGIAPVPAEPGDAAVFFGTINPAPSSRRGRLYPVSVSCRNCWRVMSCRVTTPSRRSGFIRLTTGKVSHS